MEQCEDLLGADHEPSWGWIGQTQFVHNPTSVSEHESLFRWETIRRVGSHKLDYEEPIHGQLLELELTSGVPIRVFRADDHLFYFCHGLTFGGKSAPGGAVSPFSGKDVRIILDNHYRLIEPESKAIPGDVLVWRGLGDDTPHSAILITPIVAPGKNYLDPVSTVQTKNGRLPEAEMPLERLIGDEFGYGDQFSVFRRR